MMKRRLLRTIALLIVVTGGWLIYAHANREQIFIDRAFVQMRKGSGVEPMTIIKLESGESVSVILEHSCCAGAGFDAVAVRFSDGQEFFSRKNYCGLEGFRMSLGRDGGKDLANFQAFLMTQGYGRR